MDKLEKYIQKHREEFDYELPSEGVWGKIAQNIDNEYTPQKHKQKKAIPITKIIWRVAAILIIFLASFVVQRYMFNQDQTEKHANNQKAPQIPELVEAEIYYTSLVNNKMSEVKQLASHYPGLSEQLDKDMLELDSLYSELKSDLKDNIANEEVIDAMIQNYRLKLQILEDLMSELQKYKSKDNSNKYNNHDKDVQL